MNRVQREAVARYATEPDVDDVARTCLELILDCWEEPPDPLFADPIRRAALVDRMHRDNVRAIEAELAIHARIKSRQLAVAS